MGFGNRATNVMWFNASKGKFATGKGEDKHEYDFIEGTVSAIEFSDDSYDGNDFRKLTLTLLDGDMVMKFGVNASNGYARQILMKLPNCDLSKPVKIQLSYEEETKKAGAFVNQGGTSIKQFWTKENPGNLPQLEKVVFKGKEQWDGAKQSAWLEDFILKHVASKIDSTAKSGSSESSEGEDGENVPF